MAIHKGKIRQRNSGGTYDYLLPETTIDMVNGLQDELDRLDYFYAPIKFGAKADYNPNTDTGTDDSQAFIECINSAKGTTIDLMGKTYLISNPIDFNDKDIILKNGKLINKCNGALGTFINCKIIFYNIEIDNKMSNQRCLRFENCKSPVIDSCNFYDVAGSNPDLLRFVSCINIIVINTDIKGVYGTATGAGITLQDSASYSSNCDNFNITNSRISEIYPKEDGDGVKCQSAFNSGIIDKCVFVNCAKRAIKVQINYNNEVYKFITITNNLIVGGGDYSAIDTQCGNSLIHYNEIIDCELTGIAIQEGNNDVRYNKIKSVTTITTTSGSAITVSSLGYLNTSAKTNRIEANQIRGTSSYALALRSTMEYQDLVTFKSNDIDLPLARNTILIANNNRIKELEISDNKLLSIPENYIRFITRTGTCLVGRFKMINNTYNSLVVNQLLRSDLETLTSTASQVHVTFSSDIDEIEVSGKGGSLSYYYRSNVNPANTTTANQLNRTSLTSSKVGDYAYNINKTVNSEGKLEKGWVCTEGVSGTNPRGVWKLDLV